jgi:hypothetical protein
LELHDISPARMKRNAQRTAARSRPRNKKPGAAIPPGLLAQFR